MDPVEHRRLWAAISAKTNGATKSQIIPIIKLHGDDPEAVLRHVNELAGGGSGLGETGRTLGLEANREFKLGRKGLLGLGAAAAAVPAAALAYRALKKKD